MRTAVSGALSAIVVVAALGAGLTPDPPSATAVQHVQVAVEHLGESDFPGPHPFAWGVVEGRADGPRAADVRVNDADHPRHLASCNTQSETSVVSYQNDVYVGFNDARYCLWGYHPEGPFSTSGFARSANGGKTFVDMGPLEPNNAIEELCCDPVLAVDTIGADAGTLYYASLAENDDDVDTVGVGVSKDGGRSFTWYDAVTGVTDANGPDKEWLAIDNTGGRHDGNLYLMWTDFGVQRAAMFARSTDGGKTWSTPLVVDRAAWPGVRTLVGPDGTVHVLYQRGSTSVWIYYVRSTDGGKTFSKPQRVAHIRVPGHRQVCSAETRFVLNGDMRTFANISADVDAFGTPRPSSPDHNPHHGTVYVTYHARGLGADEADVYLVVIKPNGMSEAMRVNDDKTATDQFQPEVAVVGPGRVAIAWTDRREDAALPAPAGNRLMAQYIAVSEDGGRTFSRNRRFSDVLFPPPYSNPNLNVFMADCYAGDYTALDASDRNEVVAAWADNRDSLMVSGVPSSVIPDPNVYFRRERI